MNASINMNKCDIKKRNEIDWLFVMADIKLSNKITVDKINTLHQKFTYEIKMGPKRILPSGRIKSKCNR